MRISHTLALAAIAGLASLTASAAPMLTALSTFGEGDGWRKPAEVITGDTPGTATGSTYNYLGTAALERGFAYNPATGNLVLVSRSSAGNGIRLLNGTTGADSGALSQGVAGFITGGTFAINMAGVADDNAIYVGNLSGSATGTHKIYRWTNEAATPTVAYSNTAGGGRTRVGDDMDVIGSGVNTRIVMSGGSADLGYNYYTTADGLTYTSAQQAVGTNNGDFRLGLTFTTPNGVWGKETSDSLKRSTVSPLGLDGTSALASAGEAPMDYATIAGVNFLAAIDVNNSNVRVYDVTDPANPVQVALGNTTSGVLTGNGNAVGQVKFGAISGDTATIYAMSSNQGIQAFTFVVPEPASLSLLGVGAVAMLRRRK